MVKNVYEAIGGKYTDKKMTEALNSTPTSMAC